MKIHQSEQIGGILIFLSGQQVQKLILNFQTFFSNLLEILIFFFFQEIHAVCARLKEQFGGLLGGKGGGVRGGEGGENGGMSDVQEITEMEKAISLDDFKEKKDKEKDAERSKVETTEKKEEEKKTDEEKPETASSSGSYRPTKVKILPMYSRLPTHQQLQVFQPVDPTQTRVIVVGKIHEFLFVTDRILFYSLLLRLSFSCSSCSSCSSFSFS